MKCQILFSEKNITILSSAGFAQRVIEINLIVAGHVLVKRQSVFIFICTCTRFLSILSKYIQTQTLCRK